MVEGAIHRHGAASPLGKGGKVCGSGMKEVDASAQQGCEFDITALTQVVGEATHL